MPSQVLSGIVEMLAHPPDPNERVPLANHKATMFGATIPFHVLAWIVVGFRLHTRLRVVREPGLDDLFVVLAALINLVAVIAFLEGTRYGLGHHVIYALETLQQTMMWLYITSAAYYTTTVFIKISLLCQYLRIFKEGPRRTVCIILLVTIALWGAAFSFMAWVPCFPVSGFWNRTQLPAPKCYGFGYRTVNESKFIILSFAASNMFFDFAIFILPLQEFLKPGLRRKQLVAMMGLFTLGSIVILMAVLRLWSAWKHSHSMLDTLDFTWWYPEVLILSCLEVDFAIMSASMPIFWPTVVTSWNQIFVTKEVTVTHHQRLDDSSADDFEMNRTHSLKSTTSTEGLTRFRSQEQKSYYNDFDSGSGKDRSRSLGVTQIEVRPYEQVPRML